MSALPPSNEGAQGLGDPGTGTDPQSQGPPPSSNGGYSEFAAGLLQEVPEEQRGVLEPYLRKWDAGTSRRFQELHSRYKPYEQLGDYESLQQAVEVMNAINTDPQGFMSLLQQELGAGTQPGQGLEQEPEYEGEYEELYSQFQPHFQKIDRLEQLVGSMAQLLLEQHKGTQEQTEDQELEQYLSNLKQEFGDFDEDYVLTKLYQGMSGEDAVKAYQGLVQQHVNKANQPGASLPPILSGGGSLPNDVKNVAELPRNDVKNLVAQLLSQGQG